MRHVSIADVEAHVADYLRQVQPGETITVYDREAPMVEIRAVQTEAKPKRARVFGRYDGTVEIDDSVFAPMTDEEVAEFEDDPANPLNSK